MGIWLVAVIPIESETFPAAASNFIRGINNFGDPAEAVEEGRDRIRKIDQ